MSKGEVLLSVGKVPGRYPKNIGWTPPKNSTIIVGILFLTAFVLLALFTFNLSNKVDQLEATVRELQAIRYESSDDFINVPVRNSTKLRHFQDMMENEAMTSDEEEMQAKNRVKRKARKKRFGCHLVGNSGRFQSRENNRIFHWVDNQPQSVCLMQTQSGENGDIKSIRITKKGYYLVYAQATFSGYRITPSGFETVMSDPGYNNDEEVLLSTVRSQNSGCIDGTCRDSGYHSGMFHLQYGQFVKVREVSATVQEQPFDIRPSYSYFGVVFLFS